MGEQASKIGKKLEGFGEQLFSGFGWLELTRDKEIPCKRSSHNKKTHGLDLVMKFDNPYIAGYQGVIVECKNRQMISITQSEIENWVKELINSIECSQSSAELSDINLENTTLNTGLLLIHANDTFNAEMFDKYLKGISVPSRRNPINIFIASNREINKWNALINFIRLHYSDNFYFVYPSINGSTKVAVNYLCINSLYSKTIFAQRTHSVSDFRNGMSYNVPVRQAITFSFDEISINSFRYMWSMFKYYQFEDCDEYIFVFYPTKTNDTEFVNDYFINSLTSNGQPIKTEIARKIKIDFIDNRNLSPVDTSR